MKAMIFAAGLGTRLYPLTSERPKALVEIAGKTLLERAIEKLKQYGVRDIIINIHAFGEQIIHFVEEHHRQWDINIRISDERTGLLDTGGGLLKTAGFWNPGEDFIVYNVDVISNIDLDKMLAFHKKHGALATLAVRKRKSSRYLLFDGNSQLQGWENTKTKEQILLSDKALHPFAFSGIHIIHPRFFSNVQKTGAFPIIPVYLELAKKERIAGFDHSDTIWADMGKMSELEQNIKMLDNANLL